MLKAVLFDLDGTLLDIDIEPFLRDYFAVLGPVLARLLGDSAGVAHALEAVMASTQAMAMPHDGSTNREVFNESFLKATGLDLRTPENAEAIEAFYRDVFPSLRSGRRPRAGAARALHSARDLGLVTALATNPIFPLAAIRERARWADMDLEEFDVVTSYENMHACKPSARYFLDVASKLGVAPEECLMVGDDSVLDLSAADVGMRTYYVGEQDGVADLEGSLDDLADLLPDLARD